MDDRDLAVTKEDPGVTALYAGLAAWLGALYQELDLGSEKPQEWIQEARSAYNWAKDHRAPAEELAFGAVGLYRATGQPSYQDDYRSNYSFSGEYWAGPEWPQQAACLYALLDDSHTDLDREFQDRIRTAIRSAADQYWVEPGLKRGYRATHIAPNQANMLGTFSTPRTLMQAVAYGLTGEQRYLDAVQFAADYTLGGNPMNLVWMSGLGHRPEIQPFHIDSWSLLHLDSQVYIDPILPGLVPYGTHKTGDWFVGPSWNWIGDEDYSRSTAYPVIWRKEGDPGDHSIFPAAEARFHNRHNIPASEFTIHQNQIHAAFTYGFLCGLYRGTFHPNERPWVRFQPAESSLSVVPGQELSLRVRTSADTRRVEYYLNWHLIAESSSRERFQYAWKIRLATGTYSLTAVAYDDQGLMSLPSIEAGLTLKVEERPPEEPHNVRAVPGDGKAYLNWTAAPRALSYRVQRAESADGRFESVGMTDDPDFVDGPLVNGRTYYYVVSALNPHGESPDSPPVAVTPRPLSRRPLRAQRPESRTGPEVLPRNR
ncbi:MAG TPA: glycoside hydrolase family 9 protein [Acidobacteriota bacterium]|nr:glycoside hydrolase family 9 protein [Acidobacteriota bacterium]